MSSTHTGNATALDPPSPVPAPGAVPIVREPSDGDDLDADSVLQMGRTACDFIAHVQGAARLETYAQPSTTSGASRSFGDVTHDGGGTGTIKVTDGDGSLGYRYRIKIIASGALGVGTFAASLDGGLNYGATITIPGGGVYTAPDGYVITFAGTFTATDTYTFRGTDTPLALWQDSEGRSREMIDHNGFVRGRQTSFREDWSHGVSDVFNTPETNTPFPGYARWQYTLGTTSIDPTIAFVDPDEANLQQGNFNSLLLTVNLDAVAMTTVIRSTQPVVRLQPNSNAVFVGEWFVRAPATGGTNSTITVGLNQAGLFTTGGGGQFACFRRAPGGKWHAQVYEAGGYDIDVDTNIDIAGPTDPYQRLLIEYYGPNSTVGANQGGQLFRFFIDGQEVASSLGGTDFSHAMRMCAKFTGDTSEVVESLQLGPITWAVNWLQNADGV